jgi:hypothetical protein
MTYPALPANRIPWHRNGTVALQITPALAIGTVFTQANLEEANDEDDGSFVGWPGSYSTGAQGGFTVVFPEPYDIVGYFLAAGGSSGTPRWISTDTTNGQDGTWTSIGTLNPPTFTSDLWRSDIVSVNWEAIKGVRFGVSNTTNRVMIALHFYGAPTTAPSGEKLRLWHPTLDQEIDANYFDWGGPHRGTEAVKQFRVKNISTTETAEDVLISLQVLTNSSPTIQSMHSFSADDVSYFSTLDIGSLNPGTISSVTYCKFTLPSNAQLGAWAAAIIAEAGSWI